MENHFLLLRQFQPRPSPLSDVIRSLLWSHRFTTGMRVGWEIRRWLQCNGRSQSGSVSLWVCCSANYPLLQPPRYQTSGSDENTKFFLLSNYWSVLNWWKSSLVMLTRTKTWCLPLWQRATPLLPFYLPPLTCPCFNSAWLMASRLSLYQQYQTP